MEGKLTQEMVGKGLVELLGGEGESTAVNKVSTVRTCKVSNVG